MFLRRAILFFSAQCWFATLPASAQATHYSVKLTSDFERCVLHGEERIQFSSDVGVTEWQKKEALKITEAKVASGDVTVG